MDLLTSSKNIEATPADAFDHVKDTTQPTDVNESPRSASRDGTHLNATTTATPTGGGVVVRPLYTFAIVTIIVVVIMAAIYYLAMARKQPRHTPSAPTSTQTTEAHVDQRLPHSMEKKRDTDTTFVVTREISGHDNDTDADMLISFLRSSYPYAVYTCNMKDVFANLPTGPTQPLDHGRRVQLTLPKGQYMVRVTTTHGGDTSICDSMSDDIVHVEVKADGSVRCDGTDRHADLDRIPVVSSTCWQE